MGINTGGIILLVAICIFLIYEIITLVMTINKKKKSKVTKTEDLSNTSLVVEESKSSLTDVVAEEDNNIGKEEREQC